jgi:hypothetical protein
VLELGFAGQPKRDQDSLTRSRHAPVLNKVAGDNVPVRLTSRKEDERTLDFIAAYGSASARQNPGPRIPAFSVRGSLEAARADYPGIYLVEAEVGQPRGRTAKPPRCWW